VAGEGFRVISPVTIRGRVELDPFSGALRSWFDPLLRPLVAGPFAPRELAREILRQAARLLHWLPTLWDVVDGPVLGIAGERSVRFSQEFKGVPVLASEVVVNLHADSRPFQPLRGRPIAQRSSRPILLLYPWLSSFFEERKRELRDHWT